MKIKAKGKVRKAQAKVLKKNAPVILEHEKQSISTGDMKVIVKDTFDRLFQEFHPKMGEKERELYSDDRAIKVLRIIRYGQPEPGYGSRVTEEEQRIPLCRECK